MPIREYVCEDAAGGCDHCRKGFEQIEKADQPAVERCPQCGSKVTRRFSAPALTRGKSDMDQRAKNAGFHKLKRLGKGEYEKQY